VHVAVDLRILDREGMERTGLGRSALELMRALPAVRPDWTFTMHSNRPELVGDSPQVNLRRTRLPTASAAGRAAWLLTTDASAGDRTPDLWWGPSFYIPRRWSGPAAVTIHDLVPIAHPDLYRGRLRARYVGRAIRSSARRADRVLCPSTATRDRIVAEFGVGDEKVVVAPWGVDDAFRSASPSDRPGHLLFVGRWEARKGLDVLAAALRELTRREAAPRLVLAGGPGWGATEAVHELRGMPSVETVLNPSDRELAELYAGALALVYPSRMEGFGLPIAEAMASGCPVIASDLPEVREWAQDAPLYVPPGNPQALAAALSEVAESAPRREGMAERGRAITATLTWESCAETTAAAMEATMAARSAGG
jgi:glycosyltransferase involved in cell wall biosynthesis